MGFTQYAYFEKFLKFNACLLFTLTITANALCNDNVKDDPFFDTGPFSINKYDIGEKTDPTAELSPYHLQIFSPTSCNATASVAKEDLGCPLILFQVGIPGSTGNMDTKRYEPILEQVASHGIIVVAMDSDVPGGQKAEEYPEQITPVVQFLYNGRLEESLRSNGLIGRIRLEKHMLAAHGVGSRALLERVVSTECDQGRAGGIIMLEPVEEPTIQVSLDSLGTVIPTDSRSNVPWIMPALHLMTGLGNVANSPSFREACAPDRISNNHFFDKWRGPIWQSNAVDFGHMDLCNTQVSFREKDYCKATFRDGDLQVCYRAGVAAHMIHFMHFIFNADPTSARFLAPKRPADVEEDLNGIAYKRQFRNIEEVNGVFPQTDPSCLFDPDLFDPISRIVLICVGAFIGFLVLVTLSIFYQRWNRTKAEEKELEKLAATMQKQDIVPGMGYLPAKEAVTPNPAFQSRAQSVSNEGDNQVRESTRTEIFPDRNYRGEIMSQQGRDIESVFPDAAARESARIAQEMPGTGLGEDDFPEDRGDVEEVAIVEGGHLDGTESRLPMPARINSGTVEKAGTVLKSDDPDF